MRGPLLTLALLAAMLLSAAPPVYPASPARLDGQHTVATAPIRLRTGTFSPGQGEMPDLPSELSISGYDDGKLGYYIVQFRGPVEGEWKEQVSELGGIILDYIPGFAFVVYMDDAVKVSVEKLPEVVWIGLFQPAYKLSSDLAGAQGMLDLMVQTFPTEPVYEVVTQVGAIGQVMDSSTTSIGGLLRLEIDASHLKELAHIPAVRWIEPFHKRVLFNDVARGSTAMQADAVWSNLGLHGQGQVVAVTDTGLDTGNLSTIHEDFRGTPTGCTGTSRIVATFARGTAGDWSDSCRCRSGGTSVNEGGHGTHVTGSILGNGCQSGSGGSPSYSGSHAGLAPQAGLVMQSVMGLRGNIRCSLGGCGLTGIPSDLNVLFTQAQGAGAQIHTNSWGSDVSGQYTADSQNTDLYMWDHKDYTILFSAGNSGIDADSNGVVDLDSLGSPATAKNCITVGASENLRLYGGVNLEHMGDPWDEVQCSGDPGSCSAPPAPYYGNCWPSDYKASPVCPDRVSDVAGGMVAFSGRGPTDDGRIKPDVIAPGTNILSTKSQATYVGSGWGPGENNYYQFMGGTSMSTPLTAGGVALIREFFTDQGLVPSSALIKATLIHGATDIYPGQYGTGPTQEVSTQRPNNVEGWGRVNLADSLIAASPRRIEYFDYYGDSQGRPGLRTNEYDTWTYNVTQGTVPFLSTLVWTDYPGSSLVNDLDLTVTDPSSVVHYPNRGAGADRVNNVEGIDLLAPIATGQCQVRVQGYNVPQSGTVPRQTYAVVDSGAMGSVVTAESYRNMPAGDQPKMILGKTGADLDFASGPGGAVTVVMTKSAPALLPPSGISLLNINWDITSGMTGFNTEIVFHYSEADLPSGMAESQIAGAYRWTGTGWESKGGVVDTAANTVTVSDVTAFSVWILGSYPTAVELAGFRAWPEGSGLHVEWETATEVNIVGFDLYRGTEPGGEYVKLNGALIPSQGPGSPLAATYTWIDGDVQPGQVYYYRLEVLDIHSAISAHGPVAAIAGATHPIYLPLIAR